MALSGARAYVADQPNALRIVNIANPAAPVALGITLVFLVPELTFMSSNLTKVMDGGWFPLAVGVLGLTLMSTWKTGRARLRQRLAGSLLPTSDFLRDRSGSAWEGSAILLMGSSTAGLPPHHGAWYSPLAERCRAIHHNSMRLF